MSRFITKRRLIIAATATAALGVAAGIGGPVAMAADSAPNKTSSPHATQCDLPGSHDTKVTAKVYDAAESNGVDDKLVLATFEAGWVASHMNNLDCGNDKTLGVFQLAPGSEYCKTAKECLDVDHVSKVFLDKAVSSDKEHPDATADELAAIVMGSTYPNRYEEAEPKAKEMIDEASKA